MSALILCEKMNKYYKRGSEVVRALHEVDLRVDEGEFISVMGPSGSGKTSLLNLIGCLDTPSSGSYIFDGKQTAQLSERALGHIRRQGIGFVFQQFFLLSTLTVKENVELPLLFGRARDRNPVIEVLDMVGLRHRQGHLPRELSGGEMQRVAIARALVNNPRLLLADEPTGNLDSANADRVMELFRQLNAGGITVIMVTHNSDLARQAERTITIRDGRIRGECEQWERE
ncbi:MAG: ABC transporter ATP-binding protein [Bacillota bacterium]